MNSPIQRGTAGELPSRQPNRDAAGSPPPAYFEAGAEEASEEAGAEETVVHYYFPVEIEVRAAPDAVDADEIVRLTLDRLATRLENS
jgi:hypothetical protein